MIACPSCHVIHWPLDLPIEERNPETLDTRPVPGMPWPTPPYYRAAAFTDRRGS